MPKKRNKLKNQSQKTESLLKGQSLNNDCLSKYEQNFRFSFGCYYRIFIFILLLILY